VLQELQIEQDDYEGLEEILESDPQPVVGVKAKLLSFCHTMKSVLTRWPMLRGNLDTATVIRSAEEDGIQYAKKNDREVREYVTQIRERMKDLTACEIHVGWTSEEEERLAQIQNTLESERQELLVQQNRLKELLGNAEAAVARGDLTEAGKTLEIARRIAGKTGLEHIECDRVLSLYRGELSRGRESLRDWLLHLNPIQFELETASLFRKLGYEAQVTKASGDGGVDVMATYLHRRYVIQCKRYRHPITPNLIREFATVIRNFDADHGIFVATSTFSEGCRQEAQLHGIRLIDLEDLVHLYRDSSQETPPIADPYPDNEDGGARLEENQSAILDALEQSDTLLLATEVAERARLQLPDCQRALRILLTRGLVRREGRARGTRYALASQPVGLVV
jgi:restriction system protein